MREITHGIVGNNYPREIRELVKEKRRARRKWQQTRDPNDKTVLINKSQQLKRVIQKLKEASIAVSYTHLLTKYKLLMNQNVLKWTETLTKFKNQFILEFTVVTISNSQTKYLLHSQHFRKLKLFSVTTLCGDNIQQRWSTVHA